MPGALHMAAAADGDVPAAAISQVYANSAVAAAASRTFNSASFGASATDRRLYLHTFAGGAARNLVAFRAGGIDANILFANSFYAFGYVDMPGVATSGAYYVEWDGAKASFGIRVDRVTGLLSPTPTDGGFAPFSGLVASNALKVHPGGVVSAYLYGGGTGSRTVTWAGMTEGLDAYIRTVAADGYAEMHSGASAAFADVQSPAAISATLSGNLADSKAAYIWALR